jgi:hypothetical protein
MLKNLAGLECKVEERIIKLICDPDCPLNHLKEAIFQFTKYIGQLEEYAKQAAEKAKTEQDSEVKIDAEPN